MIESFIGEIVETAFRFAPRGYARCDGEILSVAQNQALFSLIGTIYGGDGRQVFRLPDLRGRTPFGAMPSQDSDWQPAMPNSGQQLGAEAVALTTDQLPAHGHPLAARRGAATTSIPGDAYFSAANGAVYGDADSLVRLSGADLSTVGDGMPHDNMQPYLTINMCIALQGEFPSRG